MLDHQFINVLAMLTAVFLNLVYIFVIMVDALSFIFSKRSINRIKNLLSSLRKKTITEPLKIPGHLAIVFAADELINLTLLCDFIIYASENGVRQLTFYDANGRVLNLIDELEQVFYKTTRRKQLNRNVFFKKTTDIIGGLQVYALNRKHGKDMLIDICTELCQSSEKITSKLVQRRLDENNVYEVDFLVTIGCANTLQDFPPWSLRLAEILHLDRLEQRDRLAEREFNYMLHVFSSRDRRMGC